jgi:hypothetical protein
LASLRPVTGRTVIQRSGGVLGTTNFPATEKVSKLRVIVPACPSHIRVPRANLSGSKGRGNEMPDVRIELEVVGSGPVPRADVHLFRVVARFDGPIETLTATVLVQRQDDEAAMRAKAVSRAKELALQFFQQGHL